MDNACKEKRTYYRVELELQSALSIGAADSVETDCDLVLDSRGLPMIPATSLTGAFRNHLTKDDADSLFGKLGDDESAVRVYDGVFVLGTNSEVSVRDNVKLKKRLAEERLKFDREVASRGAHFCTILEIVRDEKRVEMEDGNRSWTEEVPLDADAKLETLIASLNSGHIRLGAKKTRGLGRVSITSCKKLTFNLGDKQNRDEWIAFDPFDAQPWMDVEELTIGAGTISDMAHLTLMLQQVGGSCVREYNTDPDSYDFRQLVIPGVTTVGADGQEHEAAVIPGTSWAGAIRERYTEFAPPEMVDRLFGKIGEDGTAKSLINFDESILEGGEWKTYTRNAIDRFTGGTLDTALFKQRGYFGGSTKLEVSIQLSYKEKAKEDSKNQDGQDETPSASIGQFMAEKYISIDLQHEDLKPLVIALADLHNGFIAVGGLASVGYGLFRITGIDVNVKGQNVSQAFKGAFMQPAFDDDDTLIAPCVDEAARVLAPQHPSDNEKEAL